MFSRQNFWLKLIIFSNGLYAGIFVPPKQMLYQFILIVIYISCDWHTMKNTARALSRAVMFLNAFWILGLLTGMDFFYMLQFTLRIILLLLLSVYLIGSTKADDQVKDSRLLLKYQLIKNIYFYLLATVMFIKRYQKFHTTSGEIQRSFNLNRILQNWFGSLRDNFAHAEQIGDRVTAILDAKIIPRPFLTGANTFAVGFLAVSMIVYSL